MNRRWRQQDGRAGVEHLVVGSSRLLTDGGEEDADEPEETDDAAVDEDDGPAPTDVADLDRSNVEVTGAGEAEPVDPKWEKPDVDDIPEFEVRADHPRTKPPDSGDSQREQAAGRDADEQDPAADPTEGMPNTARSPNESRIKREGTEGYVAALELCARLPEDIRLPEQAADLVPAAVEAELERDIQSFAAAEFGDQSPHVDVLDFVDHDGDVWVRIRMGVPADAFAEFDPETVQRYALQQLEGLI